MIRFCYVTLAVILISTNASAMISGEEDYQRADTLHRLADKVYSLGVVPEWIGDSHYFWYSQIPALPLLWKRLPLQLS